MLSRATLTSIAGPSADGGGPSAQDRNARFRAFREGAFSANFLRQAPMERFWLSDLRRFHLFLHLHRQSEWMRGGTSGPFPFARVAAQSRLSIARVSQVLDMACATGDFRRWRDPRDARQYLFEPSERAILLLRRLATDLLSEAPALLGLAAAPRAPLLPEGPELCERFVAPILRFLGALDLRDRGTGSLTFMLALMDLHLHSPLAGSDFIRREADRLHVTCVTIRNLLRRAGERGWLHRDRRMLSLAPAGTHRVVLAMEAFESVIEDVLGPHARTCDAAIMRAGAWRRPSASGSSLHQIV